MEREGEHVSVVKYTVSPVPSPINLPLLYRIQLGLALLYGNFFSVCLLALNHSLFNQVTKASHPTAFC